MTLPWTQLTGSPKSANADSFNLTFLSLTSDPTEIEVSESSKYCPNLELRKEASTADTIVASWKNNNNFVHINTDNDYRILLFLSICPIISVEMSHFLTSQYSNKKVFHFDDFFEFSFQKIVNWFLSFSSLISRNKKSKNIYAKKFSRF